MTNPRHIHTLAQNVHDDVNNAIRANIVAGTVTATVDALIIEDVQLPTAGQTNPLDIRIVDDDGHVAEIDSDGVLQTSGSGGGAASNVTIDDVDISSQSTTLNVTIENESGDPVPVDIISSVAISTNATIQGTPDVNVTNSELDVNVTNASLDTNATIQNSELDVNVTNASLDTNATIQNSSLDVDATIIGTPNVNVANSPTVTVGNSLLEVDIAAQTHSELDVNITNAISDPAVVSIGQVTFPAIGGQDDDLNVNVTNASINTNATIQDVTASDNALHIKIVDADGHVAEIDSDGVLQTSGSGGGGGGDVTLVDVNWDTSQTDNIGVTVENTPEFILKGSAQSDEATVADQKLFVHNANDTVYDSDGLATGSVEVMGTSFDLVGSSGAERRAGILILNTGPNAVYLGFDSGVDTTDFKLGKNSSLHIPLTFQVYAICDTGERATLYYMEA